MKPCFIRVDKKGLGELWSAHLRSAALVAAPRCISDVLDVRARPHLTIGDSFQTDGTQLVVPYRTLTTKRQFWKREERAKRVAAAADRDAKLAAYHDQKARLAAGDSLGPTEGRLLWTAVKPRYSTDKSFGRPLNGSFAATDHGFFGRRSAYATGGPIISQRSSRSTRGRRTSGA